MAHAAISFSSNLRHFLIIVLVTFIIVITIMYFKFWLSSSSSLLTGVVDPACCCCCCCQHWLFYLFLCGHCRYHNKGSELEGHSVQRSIEVTNLWTWWQVAIRAELGKLDTKVTRLMILGGAWEDTLRKTLGIKKIAFAKLEDQGPNSKTLGSFTHLPRRRSSSSKVQRCDMWENFKVGIVIQRV